MCLPARAAAVADSTWSRSGARDADRVNVVPFQQGSRFAVIVRPQIVRQSLAGLSVRIRDRNEPRVRKLAPHPGVEASHEAGTKNAHAQPFTRHGDRSFSRSGWGRSCPLRGLSQCADAAAARQRLRVHWRQGRVSVLGRSLRRRSASGLPARLRACRRECKATENPVVSHFEISRRR